jgi:hypothetical protein
MKAVNIAKLKNRLSFYLNEVKAGHEVLVRDRNNPTMPPKPKDSPLFACFEHSLAPIVHLIDANLTSHARSPSPEARRRIADR